MPKTDFFGAEGIDLICKSCVLSHVRFMNFNEVFN